MALPDCGGTHHCLPYQDDPYRASLDEIESHFVDLAPEATRDRRGLIMRAVRLHCDIVSRVAFKQDAAPPRILLDGGFVTWKNKPPQDADLVVIVPPSLFKHFRKDSLLPLWTLSGVDATLGADGGRVNTGELRPGFGLTDCYVAPALAATVAHWHTWWSAVRDPDTRLVVDGAHKGYVEVVLEQ